MKKRKVDPWFPFWIDKWLFGSTRIELEPDERGVFVDLMALSKKDEGYIRANEGVPYLENQLCGLLNITPELLNRTIEKCVKYGKAKICEGGTIYMTSHDVYKLSPRQERRIESEMSDNEDIEAKKKDTILEETKVNEIKLKKEEELKSNINDKQSTEIVKELITVKGISLQKAGLLVCYMKELSIEFPDIDYVEEIKKKCSWWRDHPLNKKSNIHLQIRNWFELAKKFQKELDQSKRVEESTHIPSKKEDDYTKARAIKAKELRIKYQPEIDKAMKAKSSEWMDEIDNKIKEEIAEFSREYHDKEE